MDRNPHFRVIDNSTDFDKTQTSIGGGMAYSFFCFVFLYLKLGIYWRKHKKFG